MNSELHDNVVAWLVTAIFFIGATIRFAWQVFFYFCKAIKWTIVGLHALSNKETRKHVKLGFRFVRAARKQA